MAGLDSFIIIVSIILIAALILMITEWLSVDKIAVGIMVALSVTGILTPKETVSGFSNSAVITVGSMFLISRGLIRTGAVGFITELVLTLSKGKKEMSFILILITVAFASAFINNTPVVVLFIPIVMGLSCECDFSPSKMLIPLSYVSILAGTCTLIGTSTNIIVSDLSASYGFGKLSMFELSSLGVPVAIIGMIFLYFTSLKIMPERTAPVCELDETKEQRYISELIVPKKSDLTKEEDIYLYVHDSLGLTLIEIFRGGNIIDPLRNPQACREDDILLVKGGAEDLLSCLKNKVLELPHGLENVKFGAEQEDNLIVELIVPPLSNLLHERLLSTDLQDDSQVQIIAIRSRKHYFSKRKIQEVRLQVGDIILVCCPRNKLEKIRRGTDFIIIEDIHHAIIDKEKAKRAITIFGGVVIFAALGLADIMVCALSGVFLMTLTKVLRLKDAYRSLESEVLLLIIGTIALGVAMEKTGATKLYADFFLGMFQGLGPSYVLAGIIILTSICTHVLSNNATAVLLVPIAISTAVSLGVNPKPFIIGICFGASACYATPIGYQTNLLVYGPGRYRFLDYLKLGIPLNILVIVMGSIFIPMIWHF
jgi:di/tricarboxylate transporter